MFSILEKNSLDKIEFIREMLNHHNDLAKERQGVRSKIRYFSVASSVTQLYAIYEGFVETSISDYLDLLSECIQFSDLSEGFKKEYRTGISYVLNKIGQGKYLNTNHQNVVKWYHDALNDKKKYRFVSDALTRHEQNLRLNVLDSMLSRIDIAVFQSWANNHSVIKDLYPDEGLTYSLFESEVKNFVQLRNDVSHGSLDSLEGRDNLERLCDLTSSLIKLVSSLLRKIMLEKMSNNKKAIKLGEVTESFGRNGAFIAKLNNKIELSLGDTIYFDNNNGCYEQVIDSMRKDDISINTITSDSDDFELGIKCADLVKVKTSMYRIL